MTTNEVETNWFDQMCAGLGLIAAEPKTARALAVGDVLFTATGDPRTITSVRVHTYVVRVGYSDGWTDSWPASESITLIARTVATEVAR